MFQVAFDGKRGAQFSEAASSQMYLPEEDIRDILGLLRFLVEEPRTINAVEFLHWPYPCESIEVECCLKHGPNLWDCFTRKSIPLMFRFCAMLDRLGFKLPEKLDNAIFGKHSRDGWLLVSPTTIEWAINNSAFDDGYLWRYTVTVLAVVLNGGHTPFETYSSVLDKNPRLALLVLQKLHETRKGDYCEWDPEKEAWIQKNSGESACR